MIHRRSRAPALVTLARLPAFYVGPRYRRSGIESFLVRNEALFHARNSKACGVDEWVTVERSTVAAHMMQLMNRMNIPQLIRLAQIQQGLPTFVVRALLSALAVNLNARLSPSRPTARARSATPPSPLSDADLSSRPTRRRRKRGRRIMRPAEMLRGRARSPRHCPTCPAASKSLVDRRSVRVFRGKGVTAACLHPHYVDVLLRSLSHNDLKDPAVCQWVAKHVYPFLLHFPRPTVVSVFGRLQKMASQLLSDQHTREVIAYCREAIMTTTSDCVSVPAPDGWSEGAVMVGPGHHLAAGDLVRFLGGMAKRGFRDDAELLTRVGERIADDINSLDARELVAVAQSCLRLDLGDCILLHETARRATLLTHEMDGHEIHTFLQAFARFDIYDQGFLDAMADRMEHIAGSLNANILSGALNALGRLQARFDSKRVLEVLCDEVKNKAVVLGEFPVTSCLSGLSKLRHRDQNSCRLNHLLKSSQATHFNSNTLAIAISTLARFDYLHVDLYRSIAAAMLKQINNVNAASTQQLIMAMCRFRDHPDLHDTTVRVLKAFASHVTSADVLPTVSPVQAATLLASLAKFKYCDPHVVSRLLTVLTGESTSRPELFDEGRPRTRRQQQTPPRPIEMVATSVRAYATIPPCPFDLSACHKILSEMDLALLPCVAESIAELSFWSPRAIHVMLMVRDVCEPHLHDMKANQNLSMALAYADWHFKDWEGVWADEPTEDEVTQAKQELLNDMAELQTNRGELFQPSRQSQPPPPPPSPSPSPFHPSLPVSDCSVAGEGEWEATEVPLALACALEKATWKQRLLTSCVEGLRRHEGYIEMSWTALAKVKTLWDLIAMGLYLDNDAHQAATLPAPLPPLPLPPDEQRPLLTPPHSIHVLEHCPQPVRQLHARYIKAPPPAARADDGDDVVEDVSAGADGLSPLLWRWLTRLSCITRAAAEETRRLTKEGGGRVVHDDATVTPQTETEAPPAPADVGRHQQRQRDQAAPHTDTHVIRPICLDVPLLSDLDVQRAIAPLLETPECVSGAGVAIDMHSSPYCLLVDPIVRGCRVPMLLLKKDDQQLRDMLEGATRVKLDAFMADRTERKNGGDERSEEAGDHETTASPEGDAAPLASPTSVESALPVLGELLETDSPDNGHSVSIPARPHRPHDDEALRRTVDEHFAYARRQWELGKGGGGAGGGAVAVAVQHRRMMLRQQT
ncbi:unnamed protein product [Vitrella brassicaformis CCMP3155]|uniref:RNA-editing substrate-binding complex 6 protein domain-containing protein n=1 Tax=Vitrella brassicaformis (strain CCMP3155) TaxID=1169540 RepID=A0A0G4EXG3_VITBC|nr:unnamed protein product [Vitrella brassicaformis CCMP3155]|eukprot:CEM02882.1 unnamed protein product [Vitrella brassicaformis CCMP3155]